MNVYFSEPLCPCLVLPESFKEALATMMDMSLLKDPVFLLIGISNVFGMAGLYVPFVYLVDAAKLDVSYCLSSHHRVAMPCCCILKDIVFFQGDRKQFRVIFTIHHRNNEHDRSCGLWICRGLPASRFLTVK